ncbi:hypothetical protein niasHS_004519 [Heterodera schachtii]|uniref:BTB domain-containing protein n=1 Tax=Heterodera schachtii TaxID=97005 RepID=A0ABD2JMG7_HETSC
MSLPLSESANLSDRMKVLLSTANGADIQFLVGEEKKLFRAHKHILTLSSDVFEAMFRFDAQNAKSEAEQSNPVEVPDVEAAAFKMMLSFIYADDLSELDGDNAMAVLYAAKKYSVKGLIGHCLQIPISTLPNVFFAYAQARLLDLEDFACQCLRYICQNAGQLFGSEEFLQIDQNLLCELFERDQLLINDEFEIWQAALRWADEKCRQKGNNVCSAKKRRALLGPALFKIRFPLISPEEFTKSIVPSGILTNEEFVSIYQFHSHPNLRGVPGLKPLKFSWHGRISDWNIAKGNRGTLAMEILKFSKFAQEEVKSYRESGTDVFINGLPWKIFAQITKKNDSTEKGMAFALWCTVPKQDGNWSCKCSAALRIVSQKSGTENLTFQYDRVFNNKLVRFPFLITFTELMDPSKGFYDKIEDKVTLAIDLTVEKEKGTKRKLTDD